ncbi:MBL fold metallo-hydrolase [Novosphingobium kaempferiae]|uniref:MBL fold metallo-hydrolase n=1 Tax=Novosphingobium kaempferiae TaxID=2896849 RepID=UPI001E3343E0|nr:MBL fold metallo-hydrolase [Novosphingobium kaempferiae]
MEPVIRPLIDEDCFEIGLNHIFPMADAARIAGEESWLCPDHLDPAMEKVRLGMKSWLVRAGGRTILVDTCIGQHKERPRHAAWHRRGSDRLLRDLAAEGLAPNDIDLVLCTHLHADHVGWNTRLEDGRWVPTFPRARYAMSRREVGDWRALAAASDVPVNHGAFEDSILPVVDHGLALYVTAGDELAEGVTVEALPGHTVEHFGLHLHRREGAALFCGDAIHSPIQLRVPEWTSAFCGDPDLAVATRIAMLDRAAEEGIELYPAHFRGAGSLRVRRDGNAFGPA